jgi:hypothetical protein
LHGAGFGWYLVRGSHTHDWDNDKDESKALELLAKNAWRVEYVHIPYGSVIVFDLLLRHAGDGLYPYPFVKLTRNGRLRTQGTSTA